MKICIFQVIGVQREKKLQIFIFLIYFFWDIGIYKKWRNVFLNCLKKKYEFYKNHVGTYIFINRKNTYLNKSHVK